MPFREKTEEQLEYERKIELEDQEHWDKVEADKRAHEYALAQLKHDREVEIARIKYATAPRQVAVTRVVLGIVKLPALVILALLLPILVWADKDIPPSLSDFLTL